MKALFVSYRLLARLVLLLTATFLALAAVSPLARADNIVQGYKSNDNLKPGMLVTLDSNSSDTVRLAKGSVDVGQLYGVVVEPSEAPLTLKDQNSKVYVATGGTFPVLISSEGGSVKPGDYLTLSSIDGVAMKATSVQPEVIGRAATSFTENDGSVTASDGSRLGTVSVNILVGKNPLIVGDQAVPSFIEKVANSVAGRQVSTSRVYAALGIFIVASAVSVTLLWGGVRHSLVALGRNPLSRHTIFSGMYKVIGVGMAIFVLGLTGVYLLLRI
ncbi:MAG TPA: hypothetical protein VFP32_01680 [Candidatus Saccharimonadales bacterium]|nr:hypothetical protein [Candidatus Saccharimonadales bacterium]